jgi:hypothetical protein
LEVEINQLEDYITQNEQQFNSNKKDFETFKENEVDFEIIFNQDKDKHKSFVEHDLIIRDVKCCRCCIARPQILLINCSECGDSYCFGFINHWKQEHRQGCNPITSKYMSATSFKVYTYEELELKAITLTNPENNTLEDNRELLNYLNIYVEILKIEIQNNMKFIKQNMKIKYKKMTYHKTC